jgi:hypothetical protein
MPMAAVRAAFVSTDPKVHGEERAIVFRAALRAFPAAIKEPAGADTAKHKIGKQPERAQEKNDDPNLERDSPKDFPHSADVPNHQRNREIAEPMKRHRSGHAEHESSPELPERYPDKAL